MHPANRRRGGSIRRPFPIEALEPRRLLSAGQLDVHFGIGGGASLDQVGPSNDSLADVVVQGDRRTIIAGTRAGQPVLERYLPDGTLDPAFGQGGIVTVRGDASHDSFSKIVVDSAGDVVALSQPFVFRATDDAEIYRFDPDGSLDANFGAQGELKLPAGENVHDLTTQSSGKIVFAATLETAPQLVRLNADGSIDGTFHAGINDFSSPIFGFRPHQVIAEPNDDLIVGGSATKVARLLPDGALDSSFGTGGVTKIGFNTNLFSDESSMLSLGVDGKILLGVNARIVQFAEPSPLALARLNADGSLDASFGAGGTSIIDPSALGLSGYFNSAELAPDDSVLLVSRAAAVPQSTADEGIALRLTPTGEIDTSFASKGIYRLAVAGVFSSQLGAAAISNSGQIYLAGTGFLASTAQSETMLIRLNAGGTNDPAFGNGGVVTTQGTNSYNTLVGGALFQPDGKTIFLNRNFGAPYSVVRMGRRGTVDRSFGDDGIVNVTLAGQSPPVLTRAVLQPDGKIVVVGWDSVLGQNYSHLLVIRLTRNGRLDRTFGDDGAVQVNLGGNEIANSVALQGDGKIIVSGVEQYQQQSDFVVRLNPDGSLDSTFGTGGITQLPVIGFGPRVVAMFPMKDGSTLLWSDSDLSNGGQGNYLEKLDVHGAIDSTYGSNGSEFPSLPEGAFVVTPPVMTRNGRLLALLSEDAASERRYDLLRLNLDGSEDGSFGVNGLVSLPDVAPNENLRTIALDHRGRIVLAGSTQSDPANRDTSDMLAIRLHHDGSLDRGFGDNGAATIDFNGLYDRAESIGFSRNGDILLTGESTGTSSFGDDAEARLIGGGWESVGWWRGQRRLPARGGHFLPGRPSPIDWFGGSIGLQVWE